MEYLATHQKEDLVDLILPSNEGPTQFCTVWEGIGGWPNSQRIRVSDCFLSQFAWLTFF